MADSDALAELLIEGWRLGPYGPGLDPAVFMNWANYGGGGTAPPADDFSQFGIVNEAFVAPVAPPAVQPPPVAPPSVVPPAAAAPLAEVIVSAVRSVAPVVGLLAPTPIAAEPYPGDLQPFDFTPYAAPAPEPLPELEVIGTRPPAPPPVISPNDFLMPPNWNDLVHGYDFYYEWPYVPLGFVGDTTPAIGDDVGERRGLEPYRDPRSNPAPRRAPATDAPGPTAEPRYGVIAAPDLVGGPDLDTFGFPGLDPRAEPTAAPRPTVAPAPRIGDQLDAFPLSPTVPRIDATPRTPTQPTLPRAPTFDVFDDGPGTEEAPIVPIDAGGCVCPKPTKEKKERKPKKPRTVCYRGTYTEKSRSLSKSPKEEVPCQ